MARVFNPCSLSPEPAFARMTLLDQIGNVICSAAYVVLLHSLVGLPVALILLRRDKWVERCKRGLCVRCGYDIRASAERCPECGEPVPFRGG